MFYYFDAEKGKKKERKALKAMCFEYKNKAVENPPLYS